ncbi:acyltransferase family protein [Pseudomonas syringae group sp. J254-4]|uniref:acyltransferase family protein n=1 Tax=Pseudomonas syringae group sp. J254-4 TaxID=3079589 RepID=UPI00290B5565|nr:acyltransferase family protein [Pseudomonas syringae group sp. J254-4]MDU8459085.1 acyltransferase family protein [Pseudomonas syringae group sp. J254-4]
MKSLGNGSKQQEIVNDQHIPYRSDIDGLRALAVLSVVIYHAFPSVLTGGFIGVDVFFVISGYLISSILIKDFNSAQFSISGFYQRRIIRLFPALITVLLFCVVFGWLALLPDEYKSLAKHVVSGAGFVANLTLWSEASYFDVAAEAKPLLHLWSLGVEEQFYLVWPVVLLVVWKKPTRLTVSLLAIIVASFALNIYQASNNPTADFYSPLTRFWELLVGALIAANIDRVSLGEKSANIVSVCGMLLVLVGLVTITSKDAYPGFLALIPVSAAAMLIASGRRGVANRIILSNPLMVGVGVISYPLYLWHWPLLSFSRIVESATPCLTIRVTVLFLSFVLAFATYKFIETPFRKGRVGRRQSVLALSSAMILIASFSAVVYVADGVSTRSGANPVVHHPADLGRDPYLQYITNHFSRCADPVLLNLSVLDTSYGFRCFQSQPNIPIEVLLLGDSHAEHWLPGLSDQLRGVSVGSLIQPDLPSMGSELFKNAIPAISSRTNIKTVIISAMWIDKINKTTVDPVGRLKGMLDEFVRSGKKVYVLDDIPVYDFGPEKCMYGRRFSTKTEACEMSALQNKSQKEFYSSVLGEAMKGDEQVTFVPVSDFVCDESKCKMLIDDTLIYRDTNHLNIAGSKLLMSKIVEGGFRFGR